MLVDTYDTEAAVAKLIDVAPALARDGIAIGGVRIDSGDLAAHAKAVRRLLDGAGLKDVTIFASGNLDEHRIAALLADAAPIDGFGVGTALDTSSHVPAIDAVCKLQSYAGVARRKRSEGKATWPGIKQVIRHLGDDGCIERDVVQLEAEPRDGEALLRPCMRGGRVGAMRRMPGGYPRVPCARATNSPQTPRRMTETACHGLVPSLLEPRHETSMDPCGQRLARPPVQPRFADRLVPLATMEHPESRLKGSQLAGDRPGHEATDHSIGGNRFEPRSDVRRREHERFAREIARRLDRAHATGAFDPLWLCASSPFLGELRAQLSNAVDKTVQLALDSDFSSFGPAEIEQRLRDAQATKQ